MIFTVGIVLGVLVYEAMKRLVFVPRHLRDCDDYWWCESTWHQPWVAGASRLRRRRER